MSKETFGEYVQRMMRQKGLNATDVERNSGNKIDRSHVSKFIRGVEVNPSASVMMALAAGLDVNPHDVFTAVTGSAPQEGKPDVQEILDMIERVTTDSQLMAVVRGLLRLSKDGRRTISRMMKFTHEQNQQVGRPGIRKRESR